VQSGGLEARAADDEALAAAVRRHASEAHGMALSHEEALLLAFRVELDDKAPRAIARKGGEAAEGLVDRTAEALAVELLHALEVLDPSVTAVSLGFTASRGAACSERSRPEPRGGRLVEPTF
jgi:hypothetical protein